MIRLRTFASHPATGAFCRLLIGAIFIYTGTPKLFRPDDFARLVAGYRFLYPDLVNLAGITLPWIELIAGSFLVLGVIPRSSALVLAGLLSIFIIAALFALLRGLDLECGCFFPFLTNHKLGWDLLIRDAVMLLITLQPIAWPSTFLSRKSLRQSSD